MTNVERGILVTACCIIRVNGMFILPAMVFPRVKFKNHMTNGAPVETLGLATKSGWMNTELFLEVLRHFIKFTNSSVGRKALLILDNHKSHLGANTLQVAKEHGVIILSLPPHCSDRLQPLDVSVYRSLKEGYNTATSSRTTAHSGQTITIYEIADLFNTAFERAMTPKNIKSGFRACRTFPLDPTIFTADDFLRCAVTDRRLPESSVPLAEPSIPADVLLPSTLSITVDAVHNDEPANNLPISNGGPQNLVLPDHCIPLPFVEKKGRSMIATNTPEIDCIIQEASERTDKSKKATQIRRSFTPQKPTTKAKR